MVLPGSGSGKVNGELWFTVNRYRGSIWKDKKDLKMEVLVIVAQQCDYIQCHRTVHFKIIKNLVNFCYVYFMLYIFYHSKNYYSIIS